LKHTGYSGGTAADFHRIPLAKLANTQKTKDRSSLEPVSQASATFCVVQGETDDDTGHNRPTLMIVKLPADSPTAG
jgi:hypothetical protein|tara:strand:+ start:6453 stop:6680 length:228 start_codon:yes stop_codon:yes gene_type:complete